MRTILATGAAGFIGSTLVDRLLTAEDASVIGLDNFDPSYSEIQKRENLRQAFTHPRFKFYKDDIRDSQRLLEIFQKEKPEVVVHLAAAVGGRDSFRRPSFYQQTNVVGTENVLEACRMAGVAQLILTSTGSVYSGSDKLCAESDATNCTINPYVVSKRAAEMLAETHQRNYGIKTTVLRIFTVFGPRQRSQMGVSQFVAGIDVGREIQLFGDGSDSRDYLFVDDCVKGIIAAINTPGDFDIINLGTGRLTSLNSVVELIADALGKPSKITYVPHPTGDPRGARADIRKARSILGFEPQTSMSRGIALFVEWYRLNQVVTRIENHV
jgi:UDP-glucuronate 4-epimerase